MMHYKRLPLKNAYNVRDLGGYPCSGGVTRWNTYLRADGLEALDGGDIEFLIRYGVRTVIDLRSDNELASAPDPEELMRKTDYCHIPLVSGSEADVTKLADTKPAVYLSDFYISAFENNRGAVKAVIEAAAAAPKGGLLFHCAGGKDRTGIIASMLLGIAGVPLCDILSNYEVSFTYIRQNPVLAESMKKYPADLLYSKADYLENALLHVLGANESIPRYLHRIGVSEETMARIRQRFVDAAAPQVKESVGVAENANA